MADNVQKALQNMSLNLNSQSASARFERFFNTGSPMGTSSPTLDHQQPLSPQYHPQQQHTPSSLGPGSSAAGLASSGAFGSFGHNFGAGGGSGALNHNGTSSSTLPALRTKSSNIRQAIPSQWNVANNDDLALGGSSPPGLYGTAQYYNSTSGPSFLSPEAPPGLALSDDDIIPTAIVVKNIPFSIKKEQLLQIIEDLQIPMPYAFNYHFDQGVFRGLAFANFRSGEEADAVVAALNGFDVSGRKLRVEYKKVLQAGEKERIEKEKAIKRMQSMQMEKERERMRRQTYSGGGEEWIPSLVNNIPSLPLRPADVDAGYGNDYSSVDHNNGGSSTHSYVPDSQIDADTSDVGNKKEELDLNDPSTLEIYSRVLLFKDDRMRDELSFSRNLTTSERRVVHMVSKKLALYHYSVGEGEERHVIVTKHEIDQGQKTLRSQASTIGRGQRSENKVVGINGMVPPGSSHTTGRSGLRTKKSAPDMKRTRDRGDDGGFGGLPNNFIFGAGGSSSSSSNSNSINGNFFSSTNTPSNLSRKSNGNLREGYSSTMGRRTQAGGGGMGGAAGLQSLFSSHFDVPPVPSLPINTSDSLSHSPLPSPIGGGNSNNGSFSAATSQQILRQPAGPGGNNRNFAQRSRVALSNIGSGQGGQQQSNYNGNNNEIYTTMDAFDEMDDRFGTLNTLNDDDVRTHEPLEV